MIYRLYGPIAAAPSLHLALEHIARTPTARLAIVHEIVPRRPCRTFAEMVHCEEVRHGHALPPGEVAVLLAERSIRGPFQLQRNLGREIYLDSLLAGGVDGTTLPLSICRRVEAYLPQAPLGMMADMVA